MSADRFVCAFRGRRDSYQVPLALAEADRLDELITDAYATPWLRALARVGPASLRAKVDFRSEPGLPAERVRCLWGTTLVEHARNRLGFAPASTYARLDRRFSWAAARRAEEAHSHLLLYSPYAFEAFTASYRHAPKKVLFQYHPHLALERRILADDGARHPGVGESFSGPDPLPALGRHDGESWRHADLILCASTFTRRSLLEAGADERRCRVIPYGIDIPPVAAPPPSGDAFRAVFVGSGGQRKGLHHLLLAWQRASLPASSHLTLVCRVIDRGIEQLATRVPRVEIVRGASQERLDALYAASSLFIMPSLVEGFGQVYLEALAQGCPVLGTANTCLPDLGGERDGIHMVAPGDVEGLAAALERLARTLPGDAAARGAARACAARFTWPSFRNGIRLALDEL